MQVSIKGEEYFVITFGGRISSRNNFYYTFSNTYGYHYYNVNNNYGDSGGTDITDFDATDPIIVMPCNAEIVSMSANWIDSSVNLTAISMGLCKAVVGGDGRTYTQLGSDLTITGMSSNTTTQILEGNIGATINKGEGLMWSSKRTTANNSTTYYMNGCSISILCKKL